MRSSTSSRSERPPKARLTGCSQRHLADHGLGEDLAHGVDEGEVPGLPAVTVHLDAPPGEGRVDERRDDRRVGVARRLQRAEHVEEPEGEHPEVPHRRPRERGGLRGELRRRVGGPGPRHEVLVLGQDRVGAVDRARRRDHEVGDLVTAGRLEHPHRPRGVDLVGAHGIDDGAGHRRPGGEVDDRCRARQRGVEHPVVEDRPAVELHVEAFEVRLDARREVVDDHDAVHRRRRRAGGGRGWRR